MQLFHATNYDSNFFKDSIPGSIRGKCYSVKDAVKAEILSAYITDEKVHDANFAFLQTTLAKLYTYNIEPMHYVTYTKDVNIDYGGGFVDYVEYFTIDWAGIMNQYRNVVGNVANMIPRVNAGMTQNRVKVFTFEVAYDLRFIDLQKYNQLTLAKSIEQIYADIINAGWDLYCQDIVYLGAAGGTGLFNSDDKVMKTMIDNNSATDHFFNGVSDDEIVSFFNGIFAKALEESGMNPFVVPDTILVPTPVGKDLSSRMSALYTASLRSFIVNHNLAYDETDGANKLVIASRPQLNTLGTGGHGRIVAYNNKKAFVRVDVPYPLQHFITLPNIDKMSYTSAFVGQISEIQLPYNTKNTEFGAVQYWDFSK